MFLVQAKRIQRKLQIMRKLAFPELEILSTVANAAEASKE